MMKKLLHIFTACFAICLLYACDFSNDAPWNLPTDGTIESFSPKVQSSGNDVVLKGSIFYPAMPDFEISINGVNVPTQYIYKRMGEVAFRVLPNLNSGFIKLKINGKEYTSEEKLLIWQTVSLESDTYDNIFHFVIDNTYYQGNVVGISTFSQYNANNNTWTTKTAPGNATGDYSRRAVSVGQKGYLLGNDLLSKSSLWIYTPSTDTWIKNASFTTGARYHYAIAGASGKVYAGGGTNVQYTFAPIFKDWWEYNPATNTWARKADMPHNFRFVRSIGLGNKVCVFGYTDADAPIWLEYDTNNNTWATKTNQPFYPEAIGSFGIKKKGYFCHQMYQNGLSGIKIFRQVF